MIELEAVKRHVEDFLYVTEPARFLSERDRDYKDNKQWTEEQLIALQNRGQAPVTDNRVKPKVEGLKGLLINRQGNPKAYSRNKADEASSEAVTDALRYVSDNAVLDEVELAVFDNMIVEGYGGAIVDVEQRGDELEIMPTLIPWDRIFFDPYSRRSDFKDATYVGIIIWLDGKVAERMFKKKKEVIEASLIQGSLDETFDDRPRWREIHDDRKRIRIAHEFYEMDGVWYECMFTGAGFLVDPRPSPYLDEQGEPTCPIELVGAYIDRDNARFGEVRYWIDPQNEINYRRSKFLHMMSARQTFGRKGSVADVAAFKRELKRPDGHVEFNGEKFGQDFGIIPNGDQADAQFMLLQESKQTLDSGTFNAQLSGEKNEAQSGIAVEKLQAASMLEVNGLYSSISAWKKRIYRQCWYRIKQHWTAEKWVRVTDDYGKLRYVGLNIEVTRQQAMEDFIQDEANPEQERQAAAQMLQQLMQAQDPRLQEVMKTENKVPELDMDIILEQSSSSVNVQQEQFRMLAEIAAARPEIPITAVLELSELRNKKDIIKDIQAQQQAAAQTQQQMMQLEQQERVVSIQQKQVQTQKTAIDIEKTGADTLKVNMDAVGKQLENINMANNPDPSPQSIN
jgi:hypothetical protein